MKLLKVLGLTFAVAIVLSFGVSGYAAQQKAAEKTDDSWKFHSIVDVDFVKQHVKIPMSEDVMVIDSRPKRAKYDKGHIPMAVSIPDSKFDKMVDKLPKNKNALLVFYCGGLK
jgi:hypothetical protein